MRTACCHSWVGLGGVAVCLMLATASTAAEQPAATPTGEQRVQQLIELLGAEQFATRERAQAELERMNVAAFDALHEARENPDIEIAHRVRNLLLGMRVVWSRDSDPDEVKRILKDFGEQDEASRKSLVDRLVTVEGDGALEALCRIAQYDTSDSLSKYAALLAMKSRRPPSVDPSNEAPQRGTPSRGPSSAVLAERVAGWVAGSRRTAAQWLRVYAQTLNDPRETLDQWQRLTQAELTSVEHTGDLAGRENARDLLRWYAELLHRQNHQERALAAIRQTLSLMDGTREQLLDTIDWLLEHDAPVIVSELATRHPDQFREFALLKYLLAESQLKQGLNEQAEQSASEAAAMKPDEPQDHIVVAYSLQARGLFKWAEREYRYVMEHGPPKSFYDLRARFLAAPMFHDLERDDEAAEILAFAVKTMEEDRNLRQLIETRTSSALATVRSQMHYFSAQHQARAERWDEAREHLEQAMSSNPADVDVLIAMYRVPDATDEWKATTRRKIGLAADQLRTEMNGIQPQHDLAPSPETAQLLALRCNNLAWLIGNTEGDYDEAVRLSHKSLELMPDTAGYLDTLGRCYYAKKDYANAVKYQSRAVQLDPHTQQIRRQLALFEKALAERQAAVQ